MKVFELAEAGRAMSRRDVELPGHVRWAAEGFLVEEIPPAADRLAQDDRRPRDIERAQDRYSPFPREQHADERSHDEAAVNREPTLPDCRNLPRMLAVIVPLEDHLVRARAEEPGEDRPLPDVDDVVGRQLVTARLAMAPPQPEHDRRGHENAVPAHGERAEPEDLWNLESDRPGRGEHDRLHPTSRKRFCR